MLINGFEFFEDAGQVRSPDEAWVQDGSRVGRSWWFRDGTLQRRHDAAKALLGFAMKGRETVVSGGGSVTRVWVQRQPPHGYPPPVDADLNPGGTPWLYATAVQRSEPLSMPGNRPGPGPSTDVAEWSHWRMFAEYRTLPFRIAPDADVLAQAGPLAAGAGNPARPDEGDRLAAGAGLTRFVTKRWENATRLVPVRPGAFFLLNPNAPGQPGVTMADGVEYPEFGAEITYTWNLVPRECVPFQAIVGCTAAVNGDPFDGFSSETLLFRSATLREQMGPFGGILADVEYHFSWVPRWSPITGTARGHNSTLSIVNFGGVPVLDYYYLSTTKDLAGQAKYRRAETFVTGGFAALFRPDQV